MTVVRGPVDGRTPNDPTRATVTLDIATNTQEGPSPMFDLTRHFRSLGIAAVVVALSAGVVFAGAAVSFAPASAPQTADEPATDDPGDTPETVDPAEDGEEDGVEDATTEDAHGGLVSEAAAMETPEGFANHGEFVSCVAKLNNGQWGGGEPAEPVVLADLTPEACAALAEEAAAAKEAARAEREAAREAAKAERDAARAERAAARAAAKAAREAARAAGGG